jgi:Bacterial Alpha-2-macroglobulin MG10 domain/Alpha-2-macroglobulin family
MKLPKLVWTIFLSLIVLMARTQHGPIDFDRRWRAVETLSFTMPESLTQWKWMTLAHTRDLAFGYSEKTIVTQKQLMVQPNPPRFLREGDKINLSVKVVNLTDSEMTGQMGLSLTDPTTGETADGMFLNRQPNQYFTVAARGSSVVEFPVEVPYQYNRPVSYRIVAEAGAFSDGEQATLPVVSNRMLMTETLPLNMPGDGVHSFAFGKLLRSGRSETLNHHALTVEFTSNPAWYALQALPYLMEYPYECSEQTFDRLYANALAIQIVSGWPRIAQVFERWRTVDTSALLSNLEKNPELKSVLLEETPWVLEGKTETQQKKNIARLFDLTRLNTQLGSTIDRLTDLQAKDGTFPWFKGGPDDRYVTQYILTGLGRLQRMHALSPKLADKVKLITSAALDYADKQIKADYDRDIKTIGGIQRISPFAAQYLYMRSLFNDYGIPGGSFAAVNHYRKLAQQEWVKANKMIQGMIALALFRTGDVATARSILASLRQTATWNEELGMYWKGMEGGYYWYQAPVETEAVMIEAFHQIGHDTVADRQLKTWLVRQKQTHNWASTKATADAVYALLMDGSDWLDQQREIKVQLGDKLVEMAGEAGTGYDKQIFDAPFIDTSMGHIKVSISSARRGGSPAWGAVYWQYFDQLDQITSAEGLKSPLRLQKRLYIQRNTDRGMILDTIAENGTLHVGDRVIVRLILRADRDLEYIHLKDMRGACLEPLNVLSGYQWQGGLGYYESTKDVSTEFFFSSVARGTYVFDYPLVVGQTGEFSNGVASVECLYAPEFAFHTEGIRINVEAAR